MTTVKKKSYEIGIDKARNREGKNGEFKCTMFKRNVEIAIRKGLDFKIRNLGIKSTIIYSNGKKKDFMDNKLRMPGTHLSKLLYIEVEKNINSGEYVPKEKDHSRIFFNTIMYDHENIRDNVYKKCYAIDINHCYWRTAFVMGIMSERLYKMGLKKNKEWKMGRNAAIGSLGAFYHDKVFIGGKVVSSEFGNRALNSVRCDIIDYVWDVAVKIGEQIKDGLLMYLTDCFFVTEEMVEKTCKLIEESGYTWKKEVVWFKVTSNFLKERTEKVLWVKDEEVKGDVFRSDFDKYYLFNRIKHAPPWKNVAAFQS